MYWLSYSLLSVLVSLVVIDWSRLRQMLPAFLFGMVFPFVFDVLPPFAEGLRYVDNSVITNHWAILLLQQFTGPPLLSVLFTQGIRPGAPVPWGRVAIFCGITHALLQVHLAAGKMVVPPTLPFMDVLFSAIWFSLTWKIESYYLRMKAPDRTVHMR